MRPMTMASPSENIVNAPVKNASFMTIAAMPRVAISRALIHRAFSICPRPAHPSGWRGVRWKRKRLKSLFEKMSPAISHETASVMQYTIMALLSALIV